MQNNGTSLTNLELKADKSLCVCDVLNKMNLYKAVIKQL